MAAADGGDVDVVEVILGGRFEMEKTGFRNLREDSPESEAREDQDGAEE